VPLDYSRDDRTRTILLTARGRMSMDEWRAAIQRQIAEGCWSYGVLFDGTARTDVPSLDQAENALQEIDALIRRHGPRGPVAFVAKNVAEYGMGRMYGSLAERLSFPHETFVELDDARRWLAEQLARV
jgi:hypothetical protein